MLINHITITTTINTDNKFANHPKYTLNLHITHISLYHTTLCSSTKRTLL